MGIWYKKRNEADAKLREKIDKYEKENDIQITKLNNGEFIEIEYNK